MDTQNHSIKERFVAFMTNPHTVFWLGFVIAAVATSLELFRGRAENYVDYRDATLNFWNGISSYTPEFVAAHGRYFIYSPVFNILFAPFAFLPFYVGGYLWNLLGYTVFFFAVRTLPETLSRRSVPMLLFLLLFVEQSVFCFQYNLLVTCIFILAWSLLERDRAFWAVLLIMLSVTTKIYGAVELVLLLCYPRFWKNMGYAVLCGVGLLLLPAVQCGLDGLLPLYQDWFAMLTDHHEMTGPYYSLIFAWPVTAFTLPYMRWFQGAVLLVLGVLFFLCRRHWGDFRFKTGVLATVMMYIVVMSEAAEFTTYTIAVTGYALWYFLRDRHSVFDRVLFWAVFVLFGILPIDVFCPSSVCLFVHTKLWLGVWVFTVAWGRVIYDTVRPALGAKSDY